MITSLPEPRLIIPNYAARHLVHSVSLTTPPEQPPPRRVCSVTLISSMSMFPHLSRLHRPGPHAHVLIIQHGIVQEGVYRSGFFSPICYAVYPNMERAAFQGLRVADAPRHRDDLHFIEKKRSEKTHSWNKRSESVCIYTMFHSTHLPAHWFMNRLHE